MTTMLPLSFTISFTLWRIGWRGQCSCAEGVYPMALRSSLYQANQIRLAGTWVTFDCWDHRLGHPTPKILSSLLRSHDLPVACSKFRCLVFPVNAISHTNFLLVQLLSRILSFLNFCMMMCGDPHQFLLLMAITIIYCLLIISLSTVGFILYGINLMFTPHLCNLLSWSKINFHASLKTCTQITVANSSNYDPFLLLAVLAITLLLHTPLNKTTRLSVTIVMLLKQGWPCSIMPQSLPLIGLML